MPLTSTRVHQLKHGAVYLVYLAILFSALTWRLVHADAGNTRLQAFVVTERAGATELIVRCNRLQKPVAAFSTSDNSLSLDFADSEIDKKLLAKAFCGRDLRLAYFVAMPAAARLRLFPQPGCLASVKYQGNNVLIRLAARNSPVSKRKNAARNLINPLDEKNSPVVISLQDAPLVSVVQELATRAGIAVKFGDALPETFSFEIDAPTPLDAIKDLAAACRLSLRRQGRYWLLAHAKQSGLLPDKLVAAKP